MTDYESLAGCIESRVRRETGTRVSIYRNDEAGLDDAGGELPYSTVCETHGAICAHPTRRLAEFHAPHPTGWCKSCRESDNPNREEDR